MANEVLYSGLGDLGLAEITSQELGLLIADRSVFGNHPALWYAGDLQGSLSATVQVPFVGTHGYDILGDAGENASLSNVAFSDSSVSIAVARKATKYAVSELAAVTGADRGVFFDPVKVAESAFMTREVKLRDMICNVADDFTATAGTSGANLTLDDIQSAIATLNSNGVEGPYICVLHPVQWNDLLTDMRGESALLSLPESMLQTALGLGYKGSWMGADFFVTSSVPTANAGADRAGAIFGKGCIAWADASFRPGIPGVPKLSLGKVQVAYDEDASTAMTNVVVSAYLGAAIAQDKGVSIITDA